MNLEMRPAVPHGAIALTPGRPCSGVMPPGFYVRITLTLTGRDERTRASGPVEREARHDRLHRRGSAAATRILERERTRQELRRRTPATSTQCSGASR